MKKYVTVLTLMLSVSGCVNNDANSKEKIIRDTTIKNSPATGDSSMTGGTITKADSMRASVGGDTVARRKKKADSSYKN